MIIIPDTMRRPAEVEREELRKQLAEARADADHWKSECNALQRMVHEARAENERMREALRQADDLIDEYAADYEHRDNVDEIREEIKAALAAERASDETNQRAESGR